MAINQQFNSMKTNQAWSRRRFSKAVISAQLLLVSGALTLPLACTKSKKSENDSDLDKLQQETLKFAMDEIIPSNKKMPSASEVGGVTYILEIIKELPEIGPLFEGLIAQIDEMSNYNFSILSSEERITILKTIEKNKPELFKVLIDFTYESYYTNETIFPLIGYEPHPTGTKGPIMEPFEESLLDRVKNLPPMYIKI